MAARAPAHAKAPRAKPTNPLYDPTKVLSGSNLKKAATSLTNLETKPAISQLAKQIANTNRQSQAAQDRVAGYYKQFGDQAQQALQQQQQIAGNTNSQLAQIGQHTQDTIGQAGQAAQQSLQPLADKGLDGGSFARLAQEIAAQKGVAGQNAQTFQSFGATQGGNYQGLTAGTNAAGQVQAGDSIHQLANAFAAQNATTQAKKDDLTSQQGATFVKNLGSLRDSERNYQLAVGTLGNNVSRTQEQMRNDQMNQRIKTAAQKLDAQKFNITTALKDRSFQLDVKKYGLAAAKDQYQLAHQIGPYAPRANPKGGLSATAANAAFGKIDAARSVVQQLRNQHMAPAKIRQALANGYYTITGTDAKGNPTTKNYSVPKVADGPLVTAALDLAQNGYLTTQSVSALHSLGLTIGSRYHYQKPQPPGTSRPVDLTGLPVK